MGSGAWMVDADRTVSFHLIVNETALRPGADAKITPAGRHTAWKIRDVEAFRGRMKALNISFHEIGNLTGDPQLFRLIRRVILGNSRARRAADSCVGLKLHEAADAHIKARGEYDAPAKM